MANIRITRRVRRRLTPIATTLLILFIIWNLILSYDSTIRLALHFNGQRLYNTFRATLINHDAWLQKPARYPINLSKDVGYLIKTGYGTRHRVPAQLEAFRHAGNLLGKEERSFIVVGDWTTVNATDADVLGVRVYDAVRLLMETKTSTELQNHDRFVKYRTLQEAVESGDEDRAQYIGRSFGWELDALKFITGMELLYEKMPNKKWYLILDDDTFVIKPSLELFLNHLDSNKPQYIGNAVGDFKGRFGHGGSGIIISGAAMTLLFDRPDIVASAYLESMDEKWGDRLVATTLQKLGIYIDERYNHHFNGEPPLITRITPERFCSPLLTFHGLRKAGTMQAVGRTLARVEHPMLWGELWQHFGGYPIQQLGEQSVQRGQDHVGPTDEDSKGLKIYDKIGSAERCRRKCEKGCLAWTLEEETGKCLVSPWMVIGGDGAEGKISGVNWKAVEKMLWNCS